MFSRVTMGFGAAVIAVSVLAAATGATTTGTATIPALLGGLLVLLGWLDTRTAAQQSGRLRSQSRFPIIVAAALVFSSVRGITLIADAPGSGATPGATGIFLVVMVVAGIGHIVFGAWSDIAEARRVARAAAQQPAASQPAAQQSAAPRPAAPRSRRSGRSGRSGR